jgi:hypothetical protein
MPKMIDSRVTKADREALAELARTDRTAFAEVITEYIDPTYLTLDLAGQFMNTREMKFGDILVKKFKGKYHVQQIVPGQITLGEQITVREKALGWNLDILAAKAQYNELELKHGGPEYSPEVVRGDIRKALEEAILMRSWNALANIWTTGNASALTYSGSSSSNWVSGSSALTASVLDAAIDHVNYWSGSVKAIIGTELALAPLTTFGQYKVIGTSPNEILVMNGQPAGTFQNVSPFGNGPKAVESYRGVSNIVRLKQIYNETEYPRVPLLPDTQVLVIGENIGEFITYGGPQTKEWTDMEPTPPYWNFEIWQQFGMMIWNAMGLVKIELSAQTIP